MTATINASNSGSGGLISTGDASGSLALQTAGTTAVTIDTSQNVGIGTTTPDVFSRGYTKTVGISSSGSTALQINSTGDYPAIELGRGGVRKFVINAQSTESLIGNLEAVPMTFYTNNTERMRISSSGVVSGTSGTGGSYILSFTNNSNGANDSGFNIVAGTSSTSTYIINAGNNSSASFRVYGNGTYGTVSDANRKKNVETARGYLQDLQQLRVVKYNWIEQEDTTPKELGFIAQEVEQVFAGLVETDADNLKMIKQPVLIPMLVKAIQELKAINDTQAELISGQAATINALTARIVAIESK